MHHGYYVPEDRTDHVQAQIEELHQRDRQGYRLTRKLGRSCCRLASVAISVKSHILCFVLFFFFMTNPRIVLRLGLGVVRGLR